MAGDSGSSFPYAALSVVALFLSTAYLTQHPFDAWRPSDPDAAKRLQLAYPPVEARLWEDPLGALDRHRQKLASCPKEDKDKPTETTITKASEARASDAACKTGQPIEGDRFRDSLGDGGNVTLIAAMLPGTALVGADELRRRARYATLAGLNVAGFVPDDSERMGMLRVKRCESLGGCAPDKLTPMELVYETLNAPDGRRAVVFWIDDTAIGQRWLTATAMMFVDLTRPTKDNPAPANPMLRIVGPSGSGLLVRALQVDLPLLESEHGGVPTADFVTNFSVLTKLRLISPLSTAPSNHVLSAARKSCEGANDALCVDRSIKAAIDKAAPTSADKFNQAAAPFFVRTIGTDELLIDRLAHELGGRGLCQGGPKRVILIREWDSVYAYAFSKTLEDRLQCPAGSATVEELSYSYLRGLDGATASGGAGQSKGDGKAAVEWPEGRLQADYVRRLVDHIIKDNTKLPVYAIGMIGSDVHDKLILVQALRDAFPDRVLFTTDMDARLLHPSATKYTRNLVVAASLPLAWDEGAGWPAGAAPSEPAKNRVGPFRDSYQTATFLAARIAVETATVTNCGDDKQRRELECRVAAVVATPSLFEIGRSGIVNLPSVGVDDSELPKRRLAMVLALCVLLSLIGLLLVTHPRPAMRQTFQWWSARAKPFPLSSVVIAGVEVAAMAFSVAVVAEMTVPSNGGPWVAGLSSAVAVALFVAGLYVLPSHVARIVPRALSTRLAAKIYVITAIAIVPFGIELLTWLATEPQIREPFALLNGVSAWPSQLLRALGIVLFAWFLDEIWCESTRAVDAIEAKYRLSSTSRRKSEGLAGWGERIRQAVTVWVVWKPDVLLPGDRVDGAKLWQEYRLLMDNRARVLRVAIWTAITIAAIFAATLAINVFIDEALPEIPARGVMDRDLFRFTILATAGAVIVLLVTVADLTILTTRFVGMLKYGRTVYPPETIAFFAAELGPQLEAAAKEPVAANPGERSDNSRPKPDRNSLLDDWIDARLLAEHTEAAGRFIIYPFILVGLLVVARSPLFDNWYMGGAVLAGLVVYAVWSIAMATLLNYDAERARKKALLGMEADLRWLGGANAPFDKLSGTFGGLIDQVRNLRQGAFAPFFEKPIVRAILVPLGGAGGVQLIQLLVYARTP
jgi:hypothetical protein